LCVTVPNALGDTGTFCPIVTGLEIATYTAAQ
jgi:hypothetical protein